MSAADVAKKLLELGPVALEIGLKIIEALSGDKAKADRELARLRPILGAQLASKAALIAARRRAERELGG